MILRPVSFEHKILVADETPRKYNADRMAQQIAEHMKDGWRLSGGLVVVQRHVDPKGMALNIPLPDSEILYHAMERMRAEP